jgi:hypothetical protein
MFSAYHVSATYVIFGGHFIEYKPIKFHFNNILCFTQKDSSACNVMYKKIPAGILKQDLNQFVLH